MLGSVLSKLSCLVHYQNEEKRYKRYKRYSKF